MEARKYCLAALLVAAVFLTSVVTADAFQARLKYSMAPCTKAERHARVLTPEYFLSEDQRVAALWEDLLEYTDRYGKSPLHALQTAARDSRVVAIGETHTTSADSSNPHRRHSVEWLHVFVQAGFTHLAVELPNDRRAARDTLARIDEEMPDLKAIFVRADQLGLKVVAIDTKEPLDFATRSQYMFEQTMILLNESTTNKVLVWLGNMHVLKGDSPSSLSMASLLEKELARRGEKITTFWSIIEHSTYDPLQPLTSSVGRPSAVATHQDHSVKSPFSRTCITEFPVPPFEFSHVDADYLLIYPVDANTSG